MLRSLTDDDIPVLTTIEMATQPAPWSEDIFKKCMFLGSDAWVIEVEQRVVGFIILLAKAGEGHILNLGVDPAYQRRGFGQQLLSKVMAVAEEEALSVLFLEVRLSNHNAIALYQKLGFKEIGVRKNYYSSAGGREDALVFAKMKEEKSF